MNKQQQQLFFENLQQKIPYWQAHGWLNDTSAKAILSDAQPVESGINRLKSHKLSLILGIMGVLLLSAGGISFFAANWQGMSKLIKLSLLFSSMASAYLAAAWALPAHRYPALGQSFLLLGVLLFGNNIMLIAQIYHIDSHYPNGILLWSAGALITTMIMRSQAVLVAACVLALLWTGMETFDFGEIHWPWLIFWAISVVITIRQKYSIATHIVSLSLFFWLFFNFDNMSRFASQGFVVQTNLLSGITLFMLSRTMKWQQGSEYFIAMFSRYAFIFAMIFLYVLSFPELDYYLVFRQANEYSQQIVLFSNLVLIALIAMISFWNFKQLKRPVPRYKWFGLAWLFVLIVTLLVNGFYFQGQANLTVIIVNLLLFLLVIGLIYYGLNEHNIFYLNSAFVIFTITLLSRYFDTFWRLMDRSLFFIVGGLLLIIGGYWLEKKRRRLKHDLYQDLSQAGASDE